ncbi:hypothetical protein [Fimbriiglobus ruber]|uniref:hypothetical protein n=1 Tax=Fimbriiglobus ruber TaxID=1908690 RepID=UPI000B4AAD74|nr:hypothetical protein [Fimbriiglobus ruber]
MNLFAVVAAFALPGMVSSTEVNWTNWTETSTHKLTYIVAADTARTLVGLAVTKKLAVKVVAEPTSNSVTLSGELSACRHLATVLQKIDKPASTMVKMTVVEVPAGFAEEAGLADGIESSWVLEPREARMLAASIRNDKNHRYLIRPEMLLNDNQEGISQTENDIRAIYIKLTPKITSDDKAVTLRIETNLKNTPAKGKCEIRSAALTQTVPYTGTLVFRGMRSKTPDGGAVEVFILASIERVTQPVK